MLGIQSSDLNSLDGAAKLSDNEADALEGHLTLEEISNALKSMKSQKNLALTVSQQNSLKFFLEN